jgi:hypothetical protein
VVFQVKDGAGNDVSGVKISVDGQPSGDSGLTTAMELDPGEHVFRFEANLLPTTEKKLVLVEGAQGRRELIVLGNVSAPALATSPSNSKRTIGIVAGAVGLVGIGVGTFFGLHAISQKNDADAHCVGSVCDTSAARDLENDAKTSAALSTIGFAVGIVGLGVGAYFFVSSLSSPKPAQASASYAKGLVLGRNGIGMGAQW